MPNEYDENSWPYELYDQAAVRDWIASVLPEAIRVSGPIAVYQAKEWGVTASFVVTGPLETSEVIFKAETLPLFAGSARIAELLARACPGMVPELLAWTPSGEGNWALFRPFDGRVSPENANMETLVEIARTLARIQVAVAEQSASERALLPRLPVRLIPELYETVIQDVRRRQLAFWAGEGQHLAEQFRLPADLPARLAQLRLSITSWTEELLAGPWPESIDHVDLHAENTVVNPDGGVMIYDWEEATLSCPLFSVDRLLDDARGRHTLAASPTAQASRLRYTAGEREVRDTYLAELPWGSLVQRERGFDLAMCLGPIKTAYEAIVFAEALGWEEGSPHIIAWALGRALPRWRAMLSG